MKLFLYMNCYAYSGWSDRSAKSNLSMVNKVCDRILWLTTKTDNLLIGNHLLLL